MISLQDDEIVQDICACLITLIQEHPFLINQILELGLVTKMKENIESFGPTTTIYELSLLVLCSLLRFGNNLHRQVVLGTHQAALQSTVALQGGGSAFPGAMQVHDQCSHSHNAAAAAPTSSSSSFSGAPASASSSSANAFAFPTANAFENPGVVSAFNFANAFSASALAATAAATAAANAAATEGRLTSPVLVHMIRHLERADSPLTRSDLCRGLSCVVDLHVEYSWACLNSTLVSTLASLIAQDAYDLKIDAGKSFFDCCS